ncbi:MAG: amidinotransferase [Bacteroidetes bacterium]|nr:MAG: amidinotransferase [Bacteroidota bacterium]
MSSTNQITNNILMVRPANFGFNAETAQNNAFQTNDGSLTPEQISKTAKDEFDNLVKNLRDAGVNVIVIEDTDEPVKSDAVFPNNWISFHADGRIITYPMFSPIRRQERRDDVIESLKEQFDIKDRIQMETAEAQDIFLEGTGSMIFDRPNKIVYACISVRTNPSLLEEFCRLTGYKQVAFGSFDQNGLEIYHTNVMMAVGEDFAVICLDSITDIKERNHVTETLESTGKEIIDISLDQMNAFAGNMLQVKNGQGDTFLVMSETAFNSLTESQINRIKKYTQIIHSPIPVIETYGGGSVRCMMAEVFLPPKVG